MSRLDHHVSAVQNKLALARFVEALAWGCLALAGAVLLAVIVNILFMVHPPKPVLWLYGGAAAAAVGALAYALSKRPGPKRRSAPPCTSVRAMTRSRRRPSRMPKKPLAA
jgi:hypothetical protein